MFEILDSEVIGRLANISLNSRQPMLGTVSGRHRSPVRGSSLEFAEYRKYVPGDDTRRLDWRAWGRSDRFFVKEFEADTNLRLSIVLDASGSMNFPLQKPVGEITTRLEYAKRVGGMLAWLASQQGDAVGLTSIHRSVPCDIPPTRGARHLGHVLEQMQEIEADQEVALTDALHHVADRLPRRSLVVLVSDFFLDPEELKPAIEHLSWRRHDVVAFHLLDPAEINFDFSQPVKLIDLETSMPILADPSLMSESYRTVVREYLESIDSLMKRSNVDYHYVSMDQPFEDILARFLLRRL